MNLTGKNLEAKCCLSLDLKEEEEGLFTITEGREFQRGIMSVKKTIFVASSIHCNSRYIPAGIISSPDPSLRAEAG